MAASETRQGIGVSPGTAYGPVVQVAPPVRPPADEPARRRPGGGARRRAGGLRVGRRLARGAGDRVDDTAQQILKATALIARDKGLVKAAGQGARRRPRPGALPSPTPSRRMPPSSRRSAATSPSGWPTCVTSGRARSQRCSACRPPACPPSPSRASSSPRTSRPPRRRRSTGRSSSASSPRRAGARATPRSSPRRWASRPSCSSPGATEIPAGTPGRARRRLRRGDDRPRHGARHRPAGAAPPSAAEALAQLSGPGATSRRPRRRAARQHRRRRGRRRGRSPGPRGRRALPHRVRLPLGDEGADRRGAGRDLPRRLRARSRGGGSSCAPSTPAPTSRWSSPTSGPEENPALGRRGLRLSAERPDLLDAQLEALAVAARETGADVRVMAPMVATAEEAAWFARRVRENGLPKAGVMIEVPGAALRAERRARARSTSASLGTNDLAQYTMAADRMQGALSDLLDPWQPAVLDVVGRRVRRRRAASAGRSASAASRRVTRCSRSSSSGSGCRACRWRRARCRSCGWPCRCTRSPSARAWPPWRVRPARPWTPSRRSAPGPAAELTDLL